MNINNYQIIIQARTGSSRLPGKVLMRLGVRSIVEVLLVRLLSVFPRENILFAIPNSINNNELASELERLNVSFYRGSENDVYQRFYDCLIRTDKPYFIRITADCPLISPNFLVKGINEFETQGKHIVHSGPRMAEGLDFEIIKKDEFLELKQRELSKLQKQHPTLYFYENRGSYIILDINPDDSVDDSSFRITLDEKEDYELLKILENHFGDRILAVEWEEIKNYLLSSSEFLSINSGIERNQGLRLDWKKQDSQ